MLKWFAITCFISLAAVNARTAAAASAAVMHDGSSVVMATDDGRLSLWKNGAATPQWTVLVGGFASGVQSRIAALRVLADDKILVVERHGDILLISNDGKIIKDISIFYGFVRLKVDVSEASPDWESQIGFLSSTSAAYIGQSLDYVYLITDEWSSVIKVAIPSLLAAKSRQIRFSDGIVFQFKDRNLTASMGEAASKMTIISLVKPDGEWVTENHMEPTALASCSDWLVAGNSQGYVEFLRETKLKNYDRRLRMVGDPAAENREVLDAGCLGNKQAFTVTFDAGHGQIQLWDLERRLATSWVGLGSGGHPGMAYVAVASPLGHALLSLGDGDVRLWNIADGTLSLKAKYWPHESDERQSFAAVALASGDFVFGDGRSLWRVPSSGEALSLYAGPPSK